MNIENSLLMIGAVTDILNVIFVGSIAYQIQFKKRRLKSKGFKACLFAIWCNAFLHYQGFININLGLIYFTLLAQYFYFLPDELDDPSEVAQKSMNWKNHFTDPDKHI